MLLAIQKAEPTILLVGSGAPRGELWLLRNKKRLRPGLTVWVEDCFEVFAGKKRSAPSRLARATRATLGALLAFLSQLSQMGKVLQKHTAEGTRLEELRAQRHQVLEKALVEHVDLPEKPRAKKGAGKKAPPHMRQNPLGRHLW